MNVAFTALTKEEPGTIERLLRASYAELLTLDPLWKPEQANWVESHPETVGACLFLTRLDGRLAGFGSWDPRHGPEYGIVGHNCILPEFRRKGLGGRQIQEILLRLQMRGVRTARVTTSDHPFFVPAQRMYIALGFRETQRIPWDRNPSRELIEYEKKIDRHAASAAG
jgi:GNAT superfamily N-acetyltransferase